MATSALAAALITGDPRWDGAGSILIGIVLVIVAIILARETKGLLIGERASPQLIRAIRDIAESEPDICKVSEVRTAHMAPDQVLAVLSRSEEHTSELQSLMRISYAVFCLK